ncbi:MAG TPA: enolase C-terminal domain-like protein [Acidimicrobiia bacterium]|jgi:muconate cycloisomerase
MRVETMEIHPITMTLRAPIPMSSGTISGTGNVLVKLIGTDGATGWGEGVEALALTHQDQAGIVADLEALRPLVVGADPMDRIGLWNRMSVAAPDATTAIGAVDIALHDLAGKALGVPVHQLLGGMVRGRIPALTLVGSGDAAADADKLAERHESGCRWFKVKLGMADPMIELGTLAKAVELVGDGGVVGGDANEAWDEAEASSFLSRLDGMGVRFIEQPVARHDQASLLRLAESSPVKLCADESAESLDAVAGFVGTPIGGVSLKLIKHGGITGVMRGAAICARGGLAINLAGKVVESSVSAAANLHCAAAMESVDFGCSPANQGVVQDVSEMPITLERGEFTVPTTPGLGVEVDEELVRRLAS